MSGGTSNSPPSLAHAEWLIAAETQAVFAALAAAGHEGRAVGGAVRNSLLGEPVSDIDIATPAEPNQVKLAAEAAGLRTIATGLAHGTITILSNHRPYEVTTLRRDVETFGRHATVSFTQDWADDARRRDFTMNALYCAADGRVHDPLGSYPDIVARHVRFIGDAASRIREDYLRILRFFRFIAQYGDGTPDRDDLLACVRERRGLDLLSGERVRQELVRLTLAPRALTAVQLMLDHGILTEIVGIAPRPTVLARLIDLETQSRLSPDPMRRLAALLVAVSEDAQRLAVRLKVSNAERVTLERAPKASRTTLPDVESLRAFIYREGAGPATGDLLLAWASDFSAAPDDQSWRSVLAEARQWTPPRFPVSGADALALGLRPSIKVGQLLKQLEAQWITSGFAADRSELLRKLAVLVAQSGEGLQG